MADGRSAKGFPPHRPIRPLESGRLQAPTRRPTTTRAASSGCSACRTAASARSRSPTASRASPTCRRPTYKEGPTLAAFGGTGSAASTFWRTARPTGRGRRSSGATSTRGRARSTCRSPTTAAATSVVPAALPDPASLVWLEQTEPGRFVRSTLERGGRHAHPVLEAVQLRALAAHAVAAVDAAALAPGYPGTGRRPIATRPRVGLLPAVRRSDGRSTPTTAARRRPSPPTNNPYTLGLGDDRTVDQADRQLRTAARPFWRTELTRCAAAPR